MAASSVTRIMKMLAEGNMIDAAHAMSVLRSNDPAVAKTSAFKEAESMFAEMGQRLKNRGATRENVKELAKEAWTEIHAEGAADPTPLKTKAEAAAATSAKTKKAPAATNAEDLTTTATGGSAETLPPPPRPNLPTPQENGAAAARVLPANGGGRGEGALTPLRLRERVSAPSAGKGVLLNASERLSPGAKALMDDMAATVEQTGTGTGSRLGSLLTSQAQDRIRGMGPLDAAAARAANVTTPLGGLTGGAGVGGAGATAGRVAGEIPASAYLGPIGSVDTATTGALNNNLRSQIARDAAAFTAAETGATNSLSAIDAIRLQGKSLIPGVKAAAGMTDELGGLLPFSERMAASGGLKGVGLRGLGWLAASSAANSMLVDPAQAHHIISPTVGGALKGATTGAALGATLGAPVFGIGAAPGALIGGGLGGLIGALRGGGGGSKGDFDEASINALPGLSDGEKSSLITEYRFMLAAGIDKKTAAEQMRSKAITRFQESSAEQQKWAQALPNIMALQGLTASYSRPYYDDYRKANDAQHAMAAQSIAMLPENQRASAGAYNDQRKAMEDQTAAAFGQSNLLAPAWFLQDAMRQNMASSNPLAAGLGLSGGYGTLGGGGGGGDISQLLKQLPAG